MFQSQTPKVVNVGLPIVAMDFSLMGDALFLATYVLDSKTNKTTYLFSKFDTAQGFIIEPIVKYGNVTL